MPHTITRSAATIVTSVITRLFAGDYSALDGHPGLDSLRQHFPFPPVS